METKEVGWEMGGTAPESLQ